MFEPEILYEDNHLIAVNKPAGALAQGDKTGDEPLGEWVKAYLKKKYDKPGEVFLGVIHRLDRPVSGVILFARTSKALARMNEQFKTRDIEKIYWAVCENAPQVAQGRLQNFLKKNEKLNKSFVTADKQKDSLACELEYKLIKSSERYFMLEVLPHTGRHHQIRVQLSHMGCVIKGDLKYGAKRSNSDGSICLHARTLKFLHPVKGEVVEVTASTPKSDVWPYFEG